MWEKTTLKQQDELDFGLAPLGEESSEKRNHLRQEEGRLRDAAASCLSGNESVTASPKRCQSFTYASQQLSGVLHPCLLAGGLRVRGGIS